MSLVIYINITIMPPIKRMVITKKAHEIFLTPRVHLTKKAPQISVDKATYGDLVSPVTKELTIKR